MTDIPDPLAHLGEPAPHVRLRPSYEEIADLLWTEPRLVPGEPPAQPQSAASAPHPIGLAPWTAQEAPPVSWRLMALAILSVAVGFAVVVGVTVWLVLEIGGWL